MGCYNSIVVEAPVDTVWAALRDFHDMSWCPNVIEQCVAVGEIAGDQIGAKRVLNGVIHETVLSLDDGERRLEYSIDDGPGPISNENVKGYVGAIRVCPVTESSATFVEWTSRWESSGGGVAEFCDPIHRGLLADLRQHFAD